MEWIEENYSDAYEPIFWASRGYGSSSYPCVWYAVVEKKWYYVLNNGAGREEIPPECTTNEERLKYVEMLWRMQ